MLPMSSAWDTGAKAPIGPSGRRFFSNQPVIFSNTISAGLGSPSGEERRITAFAVAMTSGMFALLSDYPFMTGQWGPSLTLPLMGKLALGTPLLFDLGVYLVVIGISTLILFTLSEEDQ